MKVTLIEAPICRGSPTDGSQYAYRSLIENGFAGLFPDVSLCPMAPPACPEDEGPSNMKFLNEVMAVSRRLYRSVGTALRGGSFPIVIGGDHSAAIGSIAGVSSVYGPDDLAVVYLDGHADINTERTSETGFIHGMPLAAALGLCDDRLTVGRKVNLIGRNLVILGARSVDAGEYPTIAAQSVTMIPADEMHRRGVSAVLGEILPSLKAKAVHVSLDVDFMDQTVFPATGYRMPGGASFSEAREALSLCLNDGRVTSMDLVEYNPLLDRDASGRATLFRLLSPVSAYAAQ